MKLLFALWAWLRPDRTVRPSAVIQVTGSHPGRIPLAAARQYALEMDSLRAGTKRKPILIGGVPVLYASVKVFPAVERDGLRVSIEVRALAVVYLDYRREQYEFDAAGELLYHVEPYEI
jgi:hypothetical protein